MESYEQLKKILCTEIDNSVDDIMRKGKMSIEDLEIVDKLTHGLKSLVTIIAMEDSGYSYDTGYSGIHRGNNISRYNDMGYSNGRYSNRMYSRDEGKTHMIQQFEKLMNDTSTQEEREVIQSAINRLKNM